MIPIHANTTNYAGFKSWDPSHKGGAGKRLPKGKNLDIWMIADQTNDFANCHPAPVNN